MPQAQQSGSQTLVDNKFIGGLKTEFTGLNFPPDAFVEGFDVIVNRTGLVNRRLGFDYESGYGVSTIQRGGSAMNTYYWKNVIGDDLISLLVLQIGTTLYFYRSSDATLASPLSNTKLASTIDLTTYLANGASSVDVTVECQFADGNGYLFVFHKDCDPIVVSYSAGVLTGTAIIVKIRDFEGVLETSVEDTFRSSSLTANHQYNLQNQGWSSIGSTSDWTASSTSSNNTTNGNHSWTVEAGLTIAPGQLVNIYGPAGVIATGSVVSYVSPTLIINVTSSSFPSGTYSSWTFISSGAATSGYIFTWNTAIGNYPSNSDVWWLFKNSSDVFNPAGTIANVTLNAGPAPKGFYILDAFNQLRATASGIVGLAVQVTNVRPSTGCWFQGRVWYTGVNASTFNEKIYFSQIIENASQFGKCYQINDPTSEDRFDLLPSDGGVIKIQGSGHIYKLFPVVNGLLVFADKGVWFITGSQGIGFTANDYTVTKISSISTLSATSFVDVLGMPMWWNAEGIYSIAMEQQGLKVNPITFGTIQSFYEDIPLSSKYYARGYFNPIEYKIQWLYKSEETADVTGRYTFTDILNLDTILNAFYPWTITTGSAPTINGIVVLGGTGGLTSPPITFKYLTSVATSGGTNWDITFSEERDVNYVDWETSIVGVDYESYFITGYRVYGQGNKFVELPYIDIHSVGGGTSVCDLQSRWDYTTSGNTGRWSSVQRILFDGADMAYETKRRRTRGQGRAVQLKFSSVSGEPMNLIGWSTWVSLDQVP